MTELTGTRTRVVSIDILRGIVMVIMALDHVRDFFHIYGASDTPTNMDTTTPVLFFTRWITHFCAPVFVFLAGTSGFLQGLRKPKKELSLFLVKRGLWLVLIEFVIVTLGITFDLSYQLIVMQVIWATGIGMIILGILIWFPFPVILIYGLLVVFFHNLADVPERTAGQLPTWWTLLHGGFNFIPIGGGRGFLMVYAFLPWSGVMALGYCFGKFFQPGIDAVARKRALIYLGGGLLLLFFIVRAFNNYGDTFPWSEQARGGIYTVLSFFNANKYPPSLVYLCMTLGPAILFLAFLENARSGLSKFFITYGRVPFFYYILHFYLIHIVCVVLYYTAYHGTGGIRSPGSPFLFRPVDFGFSLAWVYVIWILVVLALYPLCKRYDRYKTAHIKQKWWLSYL